MSQGRISINRRGVAFWAWTVSIAAHLAILMILGIIRFSKAASQHQILPAATISRMREFADSTTIIPKPAVKPAVRNADRPKRIVSTNEFYPLSAEVSRSSVDLAGSSALNMLSHSEVSMGYQPTEFFGSTADSRKICYVVDCSGSMQGVFGRVKRNLRKSIQELRADQYFCIIFFGNERLFEYSDGRLVRAARREKTKACNFIDSIRPVGKTNALQALRRALEIRDSSNRSAGVIYFLTDGFELTSQGAQSISGRINNMLREYAPAVRINTIGFWPRKNDRIVLEQIAASSGGEVVIITTDEN
ncbi:MAG: VWA domain-containing protein [Planctomycetota bacterium]